MLEARGYRLYPIFIWHSIFTDFGGQRLVNRVHDGKVKADFYV